MAKRASIGGGGGGGWFLVALLGLGAMAVAMWKPSGRYAATEPKYVPGPGGVVPPGYKPPAASAPYLKDGVLIETAEQISATAEDEALMMWKERHPTATFVSINSVGDFTWEIRYLPT